MFDTLSQKLARTVQNLRGKGRISDDNIAETLREVRMALIEADVALPVIKTFIDGVRVKAQGAEGNNVMFNFHPYMGPHQVGWSVGR